MKANRIWQYVIIVIIAAAIGYYFTSVHKKADYQHPMVRSGARAIPAQ